MEMITGIQTDERPPALDNLNLEVFLSVCVALGCCNGIQRKELRLHRLQEKIHSDSVKGFIVALVMKFQDFKEEGSQSAVKADNC
ncbi:obg-like ATPase 1 isoform 1-T1 [Syngnathus typhle]